MSNVKNLVILPKFGILALVLIAAVLVAMVLLNPGRATATSVTGATGELFVSSESTNKVLRYDGTDGHFIDIFASVAPNYTEGLAFGPDGNLYVASYGAGNIVR